MSNKYSGDIKLRPIEIDSDVQAVVDVWFNTSIECHEFVSKDFWYSCKKDMKEIYIPNSETVVATINKEIVGFISLLDNIVASIFVLPEYQNRGIGLQLLNHAFEVRNSLTLNVYEKNTKARQFYESQGFEEKEQGIDEHTGEPEITMVWSRS
ncbi:GNAT family N-acetyltransferase [Xenorhabdus bovienii]|uniref:N-acetyltransferase domain-containing protein n=1 Tax=Xenorhabdus bovienii str. feltiae Moldova TaxID=1398200 RepID=A0A077NF97_XENBV|nr:GNAT family N-acetyltransferase [Xenorhabdus bovienii]CDH00812.1 conserved hypothetical protein [Xenorhabdus bovienii str. feltiae Moldova]